MSVKKEISISRPLPNIILKRNSISIINPKIAKPVYKEDIIYQSKIGDFLRLQDPEETIILLNRLNLVTMRSHTVAKLMRAGKVVWEKTSEYIASVIGHDNYDIVFSSLCSVISQEFKVRSILALLTVPKKSPDQQSRSSQSDFDKKVMIDNEVQTVESCLSYKKPQVKRMKRKQSPYVVMEKDTTKYVIYPENFEKFNESESLVLKTETIDSPDDSQISFINSAHDSEHLSMLKCDDDSRDSIGNLSSLSITTTPELMKAPLMLIDRVTEKSSTSTLAMPDETKLKIVPQYLPQGLQQGVTTLTMLDGTQIEIPCKIEDDFHIATPEILKLVSPEHRRKLLWFQAYTDWRYCMTRDEEDNLPIHLAVLNDDVNLVKRQCLVLKTKNESVDITNGDNMTALQMSILAGTPACTALLVKLGANPLVTDEEYRTCFHLAAEAGIDHLQPLVEKCQEDPLSVLRSNELWNPELALKPQDYQAKYLLQRVSTMFDSQGYTPLMLASKLGLHEAVHALATAASSAVDCRASSSGATALYLAVSAACTDSAQRGNKSKVFDDFKKTIEHLVEAGADPSVENYSGSDVHTLLADFNNSELSMVLASKRTVVNCKEMTTDNRPFVIVKENDGTLMNIKDQINKTKEVNKIKWELIKEAAGKEKKPTKEKLIIVENKVIETSKPSFMKTYKNFVGQLKSTDATEHGVNLKRKGNTINDNEKPSTSKMLLKTNILKQYPKNPNDAPEPTIVNSENKVTDKVEIKTEKPDPIATKTDSDKNVTSQFHLHHGEKRKIVIKGDTLLTLPPKIVKLSKPTSPKKEKTADDPQINKT